MTLLTGDYVSPSAPPACVRRGSDVVVARPAGHFRVVLALMVEDDLGARSSSPSHGVGSHLLPAPSDGFPS